jgi:hypothetical protein
MLFLQSGIKFNGMKDEYTFVTLDNDMVTTGDAVFVDIDESVNTEMDFVTIDDSYFQLDGTMDNQADFITMDDMDMINDMDIDSYVSDICEADVSIIL